MIFPDRTQFVREGEPVPAVHLTEYRSVQERPGQDAGLAVAVAISGGGSRAANLGMGIMLGLEKIGLSNGQDALDQVDYLSTVSGGGFAGGAYVASLYEHYYYNKTAPFSLQEYVDRQVRADLGRNYVAPLAKADFNPRLLFTKVDDGDALERAIDDHVLGFQRRRHRNRLAHSIRLGDLFIPRDSTNKPVLFPMLITNSSVITTLAIFPFTPDVLDCYQIDGYTHRMHKYEFDGWLNPFRVPLAVGIKASGSFPVLISNSTLRSKYSPQRRFLHLMDGAMTDNLGVYTAADVLRKDRSPRKLLLIVDADAEVNQHTFSKKEGAIFSLKVMATLASSGLEARKSLLPKELEEMRLKDGIQPIVLNFATLIEGDEVAPPAKIDPRRERPRLITLMRLGLDFVTPLDRQILYELLTSIGTKYTIKPEEQELLLLAGQLIVQLKEEEIRAGIESGPQR